MSFRSRFGGGGNKAFVTLKRANDGWQVAERAGYAADIGKLRGFLLKLADATVIETKTVESEALRRTRCRGYGRGRREGRARDAGGRQGSGQARRRPVQRRWRWWHVRSSRRRSAEPPRQGQLARGEGSGGMDHARPRQRRCRAHQAGQHHRHRRQGPARLQGHDLRRQFQDCRCAEGARTGIRIRRQQPRLGIVQPAHRRCRSGEGRRGAREGVQDPLPRASAVSWST